MSEPEEARLRRAVERLMDGQREALEITRAAIEAGTGAARAGDALADLEDVLEGTLEDALAYLGVRRGPGACLPGAAPRHRGEDAGAAADGELRGQPSHAGHLPEKAGRGGVKAPVLFALVVTLCAAVVAALFVTMWLDGDGVATAAMAFALMPTLVLAMLAWGEAL